MNVNTYKTNVRVTCCDITTTIVVYITPAIPATRLSPYEPELIETLDICPVCKEEYSKTDIMEMLEK